MKNLNKLVCVVIIIVLFLSYFYSPIPKYLNSTRLQVLNIFYYPFTSLSNIYKSLGTVFNVNSIIEKNKNLRTEISRLKVKIDRLKNLQQENKRLRKLLSLEKKSSFSFIPAEVIGREKNVLSNSIIINKGSNDGIRKYYGVVAEGNLIGKISEVARKTSKAVLLDDINFKITAKIRSTGEIGMVKGSIEDNICYMKYIPKESTVKKGDVVVTSSQNEYIPGEIGIGEIKGFVQSENEFFKKAIINVHTNLKSLHFVLCVRLR